MDGLTEEQRRAIRTIVHGDPDKPVTFTSSRNKPVPSGTLPPTSGGHMELDPHDVLKEIQGVNPLIVELAMERVARKHLERENAQLLDALGQQTRLNLIEEHDHERASGE